MPLSEPKIGTRICPCTLLKSFIATFIPGIPRSRLRLAHTMGIEGRAKLFRNAVDRGFGTLTYVSTRSITWPGLEIGRNSFVFEGTVVQPFARIGSNTIVRSSVHISHHVEIEDDCFISAGVCFGGGAKVRPRTFIGLNATIRDNIEIAEGWRGGRRLGGHCQYRTRQRVCRCASQEVKEDTGLITSQPVVTSQKPASGQPARGRSAALPHLASRARQHRDVDSYPRTRL